MSGDVALVVVGLAIAVFMGWSAHSNLRCGALLKVNLFGVSVTRTESPRAFWFATMLSMAMAIAGLVTSAGALGNLFGWWELGS